MTLKPIRVTYRAVFRQPIGALNPCMLPMKVSMTIELYEAHKGVWKAREKDTGKDRQITALPECGAIQQAQSAIAGMFRECLLPWQMWGNPEEIVGRQRVIQPEEVETTADKVFFKIPEPVK